MRALRPVLITLAMGAPAMAAGIGLSAVEAYRFVSPDARLFGDTPAPSLAAAILHRAGMEQVFGFIRAGADPNAPVAVNDVEHTAGLTVSASPLMLAVAARDDDVVRMLLDAGVRPALPQNRFAGCFARDLGDRRIAEILAIDETEAARACEPRNPSARAPLLRWLDADAR